MPSLCKSIHLKVKGGDFPKIETVDEALPRHRLPKPTAALRKASSSCEVRVSLKVPPSKNGQRVLYWAALPPKDGKVKGMKAAYGDYSNMGLAEVVKGKLCFCLEEPTVYHEGGRAFAPHLHFTFQASDHKWSSKIYSLYVPRQACGVNGLLPYSKEDEKSYRASTPLYLEGSPKTQRRLLERLLAKGVYNVFLTTR